MSSTVVLIAAAKSAYVVTITSGTPAPLNPSNECDAACLTIISALLCKGDNSPNWDVSFWHAPITVADVLDKARKVMQTRYDVEWH
jgi:hypothetical protein